MTKQKIIVVGNGMVGHKFIENMIQAQRQDIEITTFGKEPHLAYDRVHLTSYLTQGAEANLALTDDAYYQANQIHYHLNQGIESIDTTAKQVTTQDGDVYPYDKLVLATGSYPFVPPIEGADQEHCHVYRTLEDLDAIQASSQSSKRGVVIGGGLLGLEAANALQNLGLETHVVEFAPRLMAVQLDQDGGDLLKNKIEALGVHVHTQKATTALTTGNDYRYCMKFADGTELETDMLVFSAGIRPQDALARQCDLQIGERGGIVINDYCQTSSPDIYAIGECALWQQKIFGLVAPGYQMAKIAAQHILEPATAQSFAGADMSTKLKLLGVDVASIGEVHQTGPDALSYTYCDEIEQVYKRLIVSKDRQKILGAVLVGDVSAYGNLLQIKQNDMPLPEQPAVLILSDLAQDDNAAMGLDALPETAVICSCFDVTKGDIIQAVSAGSRCMDDLKSCTNASTGCGGCSALAKQVLDSELEKLGVSVNNHLCEHFEYSRQELSDMILVEELKTFDEVLKKYGHGLGCEICKPTVGSILASYWNDYILKDEHLELQDTNDLFLGNMQKDGTYSVVPRIPAGEITPEKLITIGEVARDFKLYTKVTGGQRIDLFGAQLHELPEIWKRLIDAGFETGHAYGKSLRTVKSCVGSTWCRYGVQDSVGFAIFLENRYKGLRSPHKLKFGVSGCTRECAEAQSKDIGIIATDKGWNLFICGNGGMRPRHADLFASDLDEVTLVRYIDRLLMFYIRTADRLQRTSVWLENLDGGIEYLRSVIIDDKLQLGTSLEASMAKNINKYQCEWKTTLESPEKLKRFRPFINQDTPDEQPFVEYREQKFPINSKHLATQQIQVAVQMSEEA